MKAGDRIQLNCPFQPELKVPRCYLYAQVVDSIPPGTMTDTGPGEVVVYLYDHELNHFYTDEAGIQPLYSFAWDEVTPL